MATLFQRFTVVQIFFTGAGVFVSLGGVSSRVIGPAVVVIVLGMIGLSLSSSVISSHFIGLGLDIVFS